MPIINFLLFFFVTEIKSQIIGGSSVVDSSDFPHHVSIWYQKSFECGGSILNKYFVLTAAHCVCYDNVPDFMVNAGSVYLGEGNYMSSVSEIMRHELFFSNKIINDIALIKVSTPFTFNNFIKPIDIYELDLLDGMIGTVIGWGIDKQSATQTTLQKLDIPILNLSECEKYYENEDRITKNHICAGYYNFGFRDVASTTLGDSGGSLTIDGKIVGIDSCQYRGKKFFLKHSFPAIFTAVAKYLKWINNKMQESMGSQESEAIQI